MRDWKPRQARIDSFVVDGALHVYRDGVELGPKSGREADQEWHAKRRADALEATWILAYAAGVATAIACWHFAVEWFFERLG